MSVWDKLDPSLTSVYANYLRVNERLGVRADLGREPGAGGSLELADFERVLKMSYGRHPRLDKSVPYIKANQIWSFANGAFGGTSAGPSTERARRHR
jgi:hypothetical protein